MPKKFLIFCCLVSLASFFSLYGCKAAQVKPAPAAVAETKVKPAPAPLPPPPPPSVKPPEPAPQKPATPVPPPQQKKGDISFNFDDADIYSVIQTIFGDVLRVNYVIDPNVKGKVTFRSVAPVAREDVLPLMEVILRLNGVGMVEEGGLFRIVPIADIAREPAPVGMGRDSSAVQITGKALVQVVPVKFIQSTELVRVLTPFLSKNAVIVDVPKGNYIVIVDTDANVRRLLQLVDVFDNEKLRSVTPRVFVYSVQNSKAKDLAAILQQIFMGGKGGATAAPGGAKPTTPLPGAKPATTPGQAAPAASTPTPPPSTITVASAPGESALVSEVTKIIPDEVTNSIIVLATPEDYSLIADTIQKVDIAPRQVVIEGLIVEVTLSDNLSFGLSYSMHSDLNITGIKPFTNGLHLTGDGSQSGSSGVFVNPGGLAGVTPGKSDASNSNGFTFVGYDPTGNVKAVLTALEDRSKAKVVAAPHILVSDNREARIQIGQQIPIATSTSSQVTPTTETSTTGSAAVTSVVGTSTIQYKDIGIILKVKPQVNDSGLISLELSQEISSVGSSVNVGGLAEISINKTEATSNLVARDDETIIIGGLIREDTSHETVGIPLLSRIPFIGALFGSNNDIRTRTELIILLTPHVMRNQQEAQTVTSDYVNRFKEVTRESDVDSFVNRKKTPGPKEQGVGGE